MGKKKAKAAAGEAIEAAATADLSAAE
eukprot:SAG31_NODE_22862_length_516_cov_1.105516_1_plen_26_part_10